MSKELYKTEDFQEEIKGMSEVIKDTKKILKDEGLEFELDDDGSQITIKSGGHTATFLKKAKPVFKINGSLVKYELSDVIRAKVTHPELKTPEALHKIGAKPV